MLREIAGQWVVVPLGSRVVEFNSIMTLSESAAILWRLIENGAEINDLVKALISEYQIDELTARNDVIKFSNSLKERNLCEC